MTRDDWQTRAKTMRQTADIARGLGNDPTWCDARADEAEHVVAAMDDPATLPQSAEDAREAAEVADELRAMHASDCAASGVPTPALEAAAERARNLWNVADALEAAKVAEFGRA